jgi:hypothetical protein
VLISDDEMRAGLVGAGLSASIANGVTEIYGALHSGRLQADYNRNKPTLGQVKIADFAADFAVAYNRS